MRGTLAQCSGGLEPCVTETSVERRRLADLSGRGEPVHSLHRATMEPLPSVEALLAKLAALGVVIPSGHVRADGYGDSPALSEALLALIAQGRKRAGTSLLWACEADGQSIPSRGDIEVVVDHLNQPALVTRVIDVSVMAYNEVTAEYAAVEGEGDGSLDYWRKAHWAFFSRECGRIGREPTQTMPVVCSVFELLHVLPRNSAVLKKQNPSPHSR